MTKSHSSIGLGDVARDSISGLEGVITAKVEFLNGCVRLAISPKEIKDGKPIESTYFDIEQLELVRAKQHPKLTATGGPMPDPVR